MVTARAVTASASSNIRPEMDLRDSCVEQTRSLASGRTGLCYAVTREGEVVAGECIKVIDRDPSDVPVSELTRLYVVRRYGKEGIASLRRALLVDALPESWKVCFHNRL